MSRNKDKESKWDAFWDWWSEHPAVNLLTIVILLMIGFGVVIWTNFALYAEQPPLQEYHLALEDGRTVVCVTTSNPGAASAAIGTPSSHDRPSGADGSRFWRIFPEELERISLRIAPTAF
jgi:hypothetical protein